MEQFSGERALNKVAASSMGCGLTRDTASSRSRKAEICGRDGSGNRQSVTRGPQNSCLDKCKYSRSGLLTLSKNHSGSSSRSSLPSRDKSGSLAKPKKSLASYLASDSSDTSSVLDESELPEAVLPPGKIQRGQNAERIGDEVGEVTPDVVGTLSLPQNPGNRNTSSNGSLSNSRFTPSGSTEVRNPSQAKSAYESRDILTNSRVNSVTNNRSLNECTSNSTSNRRKGLLKKTITCGEASTSNGRKRVGKQSLDGPTARGFEQGVEISESRTRRARCTTSDRDATTTSVRTRRQNGYAEPRNSIQSNSNVSRAMSLRMMHHSEILNEMTSSLRRSTETPSGLLAVCSRPGSSSERSRPTLPSDISEMSFPRYLLNDDGFPPYHIEGLAEVCSYDISEMSFPRYLLNDDGFPPYHIEGLAEVLALERIEQDDELTYEQVIALETHLFLNGMNLYDQHRDMRLDIDNMSYEELLALEERMGTVSTALTEEELTKCLKRDVFRHLPLSEGNSYLGEQNNDLKCSICQEEYASGDEVGRLPCEHQYHVTCAQQWLLLKNWCPVCKGSASSSSSLFLPPSC